MSEEMKKILCAMQEAVDIELERKAKLGYNAVICDENGKTKVVPARVLVRRRHAAASVTVKSGKA